MASTRRPGWCASCYDGPSRSRAVGSQRVADRPSLVERSLRHAHRYWRCVGGETGDDPQRGENVVGSYGGGHLPDNQVQYRTPGPSVCESLPDATCRA